MVGKQASLRRRGFTLIELVIVMLITGILTAVAAPRYAQSVASFQAKAAAKRIAADLNYARQEAMNQGVSQQVTFVIASDSYSIPGVPNPDKTSQAYSVSLAATSYPAAITTADFSGSPAVTFDIHGNPDSAGSITVEAGGIQEVVKLDAVTGRATVQ